MPAAVLGLCVLSTVSVFGQPAQLEPREHLERAAGPERPEAPEHLDRAERLEPLTGRNGSSGWSDLNGPSAWRAPSGWSRLRGSSASSVLNQMERTLALAVSYGLVGVGSRRLGKPQGRR